MKTQTLQLPYTKDGYEQIRDKIGKRLDGYLIISVVWNAVPDDGDAWMECERIPLDETTPDIITNEELMNYRLAHR